MINWQAVIFDLDDTLYPERSFVLSGFKAVSKWAERELNLPSDESFGRLQSLFDHGVRGSTFNQWLAPYELDEDKIISHLVAVYRNHRPKIQPFKGVLSLLFDLRQEYRLGLISDGYLNVQKSKLSALELWDTFHHVIFTDRWGREYWKPHPRSFSNMIRKLKVDPEASIYVGDNPEKDFLGAKEVGLTTIRVRRNGGEYAELESPTPEHTANYEIASLQNFRDFLSIVE